MVFRMTGADLFGLVHQTNGQLQQIGQ